MVDIMKLIHPIILNCSLYSNHVESVEPVPGFCYVLITWSHCETWVCCMLLNSGYGSFKRLIIMGCDVTCNARVLIDT